MKHSERKKIVLEFMEKHNITYAMFADMFGTNVFQMQTAVMTGPEKTDWIWECLSKKLGINLTLDRKNKNKDPNKVSFGDYNFVELLKKHGKTVLGDRIVRKNEISAIIEHLKIFHNLNVIHTVTSDSNNDFYHYFEIVKPKNKVIKSNGN